MLALGPNREPDRYPAR